MQPSSATFRTSECRGIIRDCFGSLSEFKPDEIGYNDRRARLEEFSEEVACIVVPVTVNH